MPGAKRRLVRASELSAPGNKQDDNYSYRAAFKERDIAKNKHSNALKVLKENRNRENNERRRVLDIPKDPSIDLEEDNESSSESDVEGTDCSPAEVQKRKRSEAKTEEHLSTVDLQSHKKVHPTISRETQAKAILATVKPRSTAKSGTAGPPKVDSTKMSASTRQQEPGISTPVVSSTNPKAVVSGSNPGVAKPKPAVECQPKEVSAEIQASNRQQKHRFPTLAPPAGNSEPVIPGSSSGVAEAKLGAKRTASQAEVSSDNDSSDPVAKKSKRSLAPESSPDEVTNKSPATVISRAIATKKVSTVGSRITKKSSGAIVPPAIATRKSSGVGPRTTTSKKPDPVSKRPTKAMSATPRKGVARPAPYARLSPTKANKFYDNLDTTQSPVQSRPTHGDGKKISVKPTESLQKDSPTEIEKSLDKDVKKLPEQKMGKAPPTEPANRYQLTTSKMRRTTWDSLRSMDGHGFSQRRVHFGSEHTAS